MKASSEQTEKSIILIVFYVLLMICSVVVALFGAIGFLGGIYQIMDGYYHSRHPIILLLSVGVTALGVFGVYKSCKAL